MTEEEKALLGLATTRELIGELATRMEVTQDTQKGREFGQLCRRALAVIDPDVLNYKTFDPERDRSEDVEH